MRSPLHSGFTTGRGYHGWYFLPSSSPGGVMIVLLSGWHGMAKKISQPLFKMWKVLVYSRYERKTLHSKIPTVTARVVQDLQAINLKAHRIVLTSSSCEPLPTHKAGISSSRYRKVKGKICIADFIGFASLFLQRHMLPPSFIPFYSSVTLLFLNISMLSV